MYKVLIDTIITGLCLIRAQAYLVPLFICLATGFLACKYLESEN